jgi:membrane-associated protease RseP (regulator of RpoE activity)
MLFAKLLLAWTGLALAGSLCAAAVARAFGVVVQRVSLGMGRVLLTLGWFEVLMIPLGSSVRFLLAQDIAKPDPSAAELRGAFDRRGAATRIAIIAAMPGSLLLIGLLLLGPPAWHHFGSGFVQILGGALSPADEAQRLLAAFMHLLRAQGFAVAAGVLASKFAALQLLPLYGLAGLQLLWTLVPALERLVTRTPLPFFLPYLAVAGSWVGAMLGYWLG